MMKLDDRDIVCEQDYTPLSNAELVAHIERYAGLMHSTPLSDGEWLDDIIGPARALMARAEVADSLAYERLENLLFVEQRADDAEIERDEAIARAEEAEARVAELEAALAAERAAHQWRPVSQKPMHTLRYQVVLQHGQRFPAVDHVVYDAMSGWASPDAIYWRPIPPLPPAPPQEPTP